MRTREEEERREEEREEDQKVGEKRMRRREVEKGGEKGRWARYFTGLSSLPFVISYCKFILLMQQGGGVRAEPLGGTGWGGGGPQDWLGLWGEGGA
jgi:hypothetical protein